VDWVEIVTYLVNNPDDFVDEAIAGFAAAHSHLVRAVRGGVVRANKGAAGEVAVVIGGGSGHYPAFAGVVGPGLAHAAVVGNVFASPSTQQVLNVCRTANSGGGIFLSYGNYAGDVMNFNQAQQQLIDEGIPCRTVVVTDDIMSASKDEFAKRRGIAGGLFVFKIAGAAAEAGYNLEEVTRVAALANARARTIGVAFSGCTLPGQDHPLFTVPTGRMGVGLGIHGEPGLREINIPTAAELADELVAQLLDETPDGVSIGAGTRLALILNGLGGVKYEELYVLYNNIQAILQKKEITIIEPEVGEMVTSFEMAGVSLTFVWLTPELEELWGKPSYTPGYRKGSVSLQSSNSLSVEVVADEIIVPQGSMESQKCAKVILDAFKAIDSVITSHKDELGLLDSYAGDGDHGIGMARGSHAGLKGAEQFASQGAGAGATLIRAADEWSDKAGGTSGVIWGIILRHIGLKFGDAKAPTAEDVANSISEATHEVIKFGKASLGDKTLLDALLPFSEKLRAEVDLGKSISVAWSTASSAAFDSAQSTSQLLPKIGRARPHAEKSLGHPDPGAISLAYITRAVGEVLGGYDGK
jgi:dihydroxyacetone kinase